MGPVPAEINQHAWMGANASVSSWGELEPRGTGRADRPQSRATANLELQRSGESELTFPAVQMGSHQRARWNYFIRPEAPFRTGARATLWVPVALDRVILRESILKTKWRGSFRNCHEDRGEITTAEHCKVPMLLHC